MKHRVLCSILAASLICTSLTGCESKEGNQLSSYMSNNKDIQLSISETASTKEKNELTWVELDQLKSCETIRNKLDDYLNIVKFDQGSKNGVIFIDEENDWTVYTADLKPSAQWEVELLVTETGYELLCW